MAQENIEVTARLRDELSRPVGRTVQSVRQLTREVDQLSDQLGQGSDEAREMQQRLNALRRAAGLTERQFDSLGNEVRRQNRLLGVTSAAARGVGRAFSNAADRSGGFGDAVSALKIPLMVTKFTLLASAVGAVGVAAVSAASALAPIGVAGGAAFLGLGVAAKVASGVVKLAMKDIGGAVEVLKDPASDAEAIAAALANLTPEAAKLAQELAEVGHQTDHIRETAQKGLLPGVSDALKSMMPLLPVVEKGVGAMARTLGDIARKAGGAIGTWGPDLDKVLSSSNRIVATLGTAVVPLLNLVRRVLVAVGPISERFASAIARGLISLSAMADKATANGKLEAFLQRAGDLAARAGGVLADVGVALFNIAKAANRGKDSLGSFMGEGVAKAAADFRAFTESSAGMDKIAKFFRDAKPVIGELGLLLVAVVTELGKFGASGDLAPIIKQIREDLLPAVSNLALGVSEGLGPSLITLATAWLEFQNVLSFDPLITAVRIFADVAKAITGWISLTPGASTFIATIITASLAFKLFAFALRASGLVGFIGHVGRAIGLTKIFTTTLRGNTAAVAANSRAQAMAAAAGTKLRAGLGRMARVLRLQAIATRAMILLNRALGASLLFAMGPVGLIIIAVVALAGFFYLLYKRSETFRNIVHAVRDALVEFGKKAWEVMKAVGTAVGRFFVAAWGVAKTVFTAIWGAVKWVFGVITTVVKAWFTVWKTIFEIVAGVALFVFNYVIKPAAMRLFAAIKFYLLILRAVWSVVWSVIKTVALAVWDAISGAASWLWGMLKAGFVALQVVLGIVWGAIKSVALSVWAPIAAAGGWLWGVLKSGFGAVRDFIGGVWNTIKSAAKTAFDAVWGVVKPVIDRIQGAFEAMGRAIGGVWEGIKGAIGSAVGGIKGIINSIIGGINKLIDGINAVKLGDDLPNIPLLSTGGSSPTSPAASNGRFPRNLFSGGATTAGMTAFTGELGPELFVPRVGPISVLGGDGAALTRFAQPGYVVPNPGTPSSLTDPIPSWVTDRLERMPSQGERGGGATMTEARPELHVHMHGDGSQLTTADIEAGAMRAFRKWEREKRERR